MNVDGMSTQHYHRTQPLMPGAVDSMSVGSHAGQSQRSRNEHINPAVTPSLALSQEGGQQTTYQQIQRDHEGIERVQQEQEEEATRRAWIALLYAHPTELPTLGMGRNNRSGRGRSALRHLELGTLASSSLRSRTIPLQPSYQWVHNTPSPGTLYLPQSRQPAHEGLQYGDLSALLRSLPAKASPTQAHPALPLLELWAREREERDAQQGAPTFVQRSADVQSTTEQTNALQDRSLLFPNVSQAQMEPEMQRAETVMQRVTANAERAAANVQRAAAEARLAAADTQRASARAQRLRIEAIRAAVEAQQTTLHEQRAAEQREMHRIGREVLETNEQQLDSFEAVRSAAFADLIRQGYTLPSSADLGMQQPLVSRRARWRGVQREAENDAEGEPMQTDIASLVDTGLLTWFHSNDSMPHQTVPWRQAALARVMEDQVASIPGAGAEAAGRDLRGMIAALVARQEEAMRAHESEVSRRAAADFEDVRSLVGQQRTGGRTRLTLFIRCGARLMG